MQLPNFGIIKKLTGYIIASFLSSYTNTSPAQGIEKCVSDSYSIQDVYCYMKIHSLFCSETPLF